MNNNVSAEDEVVFNDFYTDVLDILVGTKEKVVFTAEITAKNMPKSIGVFDENNKNIVNLYDDGTHDDDQAGDGIYANNTTIDATEVATKNYYAKCNDIKSESTEINFYRLFTNAEKEAQSLTINDVSAIRSKYILTEDYDENVRRFNNCRDEILSYLSSRKNEGSILEYTEGETGIEISLLGDVLFDVSYDGLLISEKSQNSKIATVSSRKKVNVNTESSNSPYNKIINLYPCVNTIFSGHEEAAQYVADHSGPTYTFDGSLYNTDVSLDLCKEFYKYDIIIISTHGCVDGFLIGDIYDENNVDDYTADLKANRIGVGQGGGEPYAQYYLRQTFFRDCFKGEKKLKDSLFWIGGCEVADGNIPQAILDAGASAVCAYHNPLDKNSGYNNNMIKTTFTNLCEGKTLRDSVKKAKDIHGSVDPETQTVAHFLFKNDQFLSPAELEVFGNKYYSLDILDDSGFDPSDGIGSNDGWIDSTLFNFGSYPQTDVTDSLGSVLNAKARDWKSYKYYSRVDYEIEASDYMMYCDVIYGSSKYRGVMFDKYRPGFSDLPASQIINSASGSQQANNGYFCGKVYWFKYEPLKWRVLDQSTGLVICDSIIDSQPYSIYFRYSVDDYEHYNDKGAYISDWETSSLRTWLNTNFYATAFTSNQQNRIKSETHSNKGVLTLNGYSGYEKYDGKDTSEKIYLLSYDEVKNTSDFTDYEAQGSDYAKCQGLIVHNSSDRWDGYSDWLLRSPYDDSEISYVDKFGMYSDNRLTAALNYYGVRPALKLDLSPLAS